jgi:hypothetical protein
MAELSLWKGIGRAILEIAPIVITACETERTMQTKKIRAKVEKPRAHFEGPNAVVTDTALSSQEKVKALGMMEQDARLLATATTEGMVGGEPSNLREILQAKGAMKNQAAKRTRTTVNNPPPGSQAEVTKEVEIEKLDP